ncbi:hypothetical protein DFS34DRAFT_630994 [Phlyctochytrium arcticum]|nr:hypothetical protein DFS34DRAFT_630994 [Phlyctochytrium arcticum]
MNNTVQVPCPIPNCLSTIRVHDGILLNVYRHIKRCLMRRRMTDTRPEAYHCPMCETSRSFAARDYAHFVCIHYPAHIRPGSQVNNPGTGFNPYLLVTFSNNRKCLDPLSSALSQFDNLIATTGRPAHNRFNQNLGAPEPEQQADEMSNHFADSSDIFDGDAGLGHDDPSHGSESNAAQEGWDSYNIFHGSEENAAQEGVDRDEIDPGDESSSETSTSSSSSNHSSSRDEPDDDQPSNGNQLTNTGYASQQILWRPRVAQPLRFTHRDEEYAEFMLHTLKQKWTRRQYESFFALKFMTEGAASGHGLPTKHETAKQR